MRRTKASLLMIAAILSAGVASLLGAAETQKGFKNLFDGKSLRGWVVRNEAGHGWGSDWEVADGSIAGIQEWPGSWGMLATRQKFGDFELRLEVRTEWPIDSAVMLRSSFDGRAYQVLIQTHEGGDVGGVSGRLIGEFHVAAKDWKKAWKKNDWNRIKIIIKGNPPEIHTWLNGKHMVDFKDKSEKPRLPKKGHIALAVYGTDECFNNRVYFRNITIRKIK